MKNGVYAHIWVIRGRCEDGTMYAQADETDKVWSWTFDPRDATLFANRRRLRRALKTARKSRGMFRVCAPWFVQIIRCRKSWLYHFRSRGARETFVDAFLGRGALAWSLFARRAGRLSISIKRLTPNAPALLPPGIREQINA